jgi:hypothetical protein
MFYWRIEATAYTKVDYRPKGVSGESRNIIIKISQTLFEFGFCKTINTSSQELFTENT